MAGAASFHFVFRQFTVSSLQKPFVDANSGCLLFSTVPRRAQALIRAKEQAAVPPGVTLSIIGDTFCLRSFYWRH